MKKVLIYLQEDSLAPVGGQRGYVYNLLAGWENDDEICIDFLHAQSVRQKYHKYYERLPACIRRLYVSRQNLRDCRRMTDASSKTSDVDFSEYDAVHFHTTFDYYNCKDSLQGYRGLVLLTSHSPKPWHLEKIEDGISARDRMRYESEYRKLEMVDEFAFMHADYIVFPCEEAEEPYMHRWERFEQIKKRRGKDFRYMLSGVVSHVVEEPSEVIRRKYNIPEDAFVVSYVGRHNEVKGYDFLKRVGEILLAKYENLYFLCAGREEPISGLNHERWMEIGWTQEPETVIHCSDVFVLPNRETYFDLVLLEVLSIGTPVVVSDTGGNRYFHKYNCPGISFFAGEKECVDAICRMQDTDRDERQAMRRDNRNLYLREYHEKVFADRYRGLLSALLDGADV